jgi:4'-phosphopantetheinyl transferase
MGVEAVEVWAADVDSGRFDGSVCNAAEHDRASSFGDRRAGARWLAARHFLRVVLSRRLQVAPAALVFEFGPHGKPSASGTWGTSSTSGTSGTEFNLAHSGGLAVVALASRPVGVDVEVRRRVARPEGVARRLGVAWPVTDEELLRAWCRTEALVKATGDGATRGLARVEERLGRDGWTVADLHLGEDTCGAVAAQGDDWVVAGPAWA